MKSRIVSAVTAVVLLLAPTAAGLEAGLGSSASRSAAGPLSMAQIPVTPAATARATETLQFLSALQHRSSDKFLTGQFVAPNYGRPERSTPGITLTTVQDCWNYHIGRVQTATGESPALVGFDLTNRTFDKSGTATTAANMPSDSNILAPSKAHAANGGVVTLSWHASNPWTAEDAWSRIPSGHTLSEAYTPGTAAYREYMQWLTGVGDILQRYSDAGVPVVWRPFHEMNGTSFWWGYHASGAAPAAQYTALWKHMYDYLTVQRGLTNVLWAWSPNSGTAFGRAITDRYPGDAYVDVLGHERYWRELTDTARYDWMIQKNKVILFTEAGQTTGTSAPWDTTQMLREVRGRFPKVVGAMNWMKTTVDYSIIGNLNASAYMNDPLSLTLDEMPGRITDSAAPTVLYSGVWTHSADAGYYSGTKSVSNRAGARAALTFTGTSVSVWGRTLSSKGGKFDLWIDGRLHQANITTTAATTQFGVKLAEVTGLTAGTHTVEVRLSNPLGYVGFDYFGVK
ncbi:glycosyl hydrolase [Rathayibacter sp. VKM Ac-2630]|uniref:glycosyl hydrolase n=1 Tax=Rathayibacter sp. VKM Ac-2630 TaxID=1938617 RepID=UPI00098188F1|nr:glycosyl hydrolase [Rathayibacter sp. VKM Ac-2630]